MIETPQCSRASVRLFKEVLAFWLALTVPVLNMSTAIAAEPPVLQMGLYEIEYRLELPHLERYAVSTSQTVCVAPISLSKNTLLPVLTGNNAFDGCATENMKTKGNNLNYSITCNGRASARATASYDLRPDSFHGRVAMVLGAKNMTMTEVQNGRRLGDCVTETN